MSGDKSSTIFSIISAIAGISAFLWNLIGYLWTYFFSHLQIELTNEKIKTGDGEKLKVTTIVENKGAVAKKIDFAFLLIKPENDSFKNALSKIVNHSETGNKEVVPMLHQLIKNQNKISHKIIDQRYLIYPLPYFYEEQFQIGNEKVKYPCLIDLKELQTNQVYHIRLVTVSRHFFNTYLRYRSTSDLFIH